MSDSEHDHRIENEPLHPAPQGGTPPDTPPRPPSRYHGRPEKTYRSGQSIYDEPDILPGRAGEVVEKDWSCAYCNANLRGLPLETPCRECGRRNWYKPPPAGVDSYESWLRRHQADSPIGRGIGTALICAFVGGLFAVISSFIGTSPGGFMSASLPILVIIFGPIVEETMKVAAASYVVEARPYLFTQRFQVLFAAIGAAAIFAAIENLLYIFVYIDKPGTFLILWRWTACVALHVGCTAVVATGLANVWERAMAEYRQPRIADLFPALLTGIVIHATYNAAATGLAWKYPTLFR